MSKSDTPAATTATAAVEVDFFGMADQAAKPPHAPKRFERRRSFRDIQHAISKINPEVVKSVIASAAAYSVEERRPSQAALPVIAPTSKIAAGSSAEIGGGDSAPLTIFFDGTVSVFDVRRLDAEKIIKLAQECLPKTADDSVDSKLATKDGDLPLQRRKSLQRFLAKRRARLVTVSPFGSPAQYA